MLGLRRATGSRQAATKGEGLASGAWSCAQPRLCLTVRNRLWLGPGCQFCCCLCVCLNVKTKVAGVKAVARFLCAWVIPLLAEAQTPTSPLVTRGASDGVCLLPGFIYALEVRGTRGVTAEAGQKCTILI